MIFGLQCECKKGRVFLRDEKAWSHLEGPDRCPSCRELMFVDGRWGDHVVRRVTWGNATDAGLALYPEPAGEGVRDALRLVTYSPRRRFGDPGDWWCRELYQRPTPVDPVPLIAPRQLEKAYEMLGRAKERYAEREARQPADPGLLGLAAEHTQSDVSKWEMVNGDPVAKLSVGWLVLERRGPTYMWIWEGPLHRVTGLGGCMHSANAELNAKVAEQGASDAFQLVLDELRGVKRVNSLREQAAWTTDTPVEFWCFDDADAVYFAYDGRSLLIRQCADGYQAIWSNHGPTVAGRGPLLFQAVQNMVAQLEGESAEAYSETLCDMRREFKELQERKPRTLREQVAKATSTPVAWWYETANPDFVSVECGRVTLTFEGAKQCHLSVSGRVCGAFWGSDPSDVFRNMLLRVPRCDRVTVNRALATMRDFKPTMASVGKFVENCGVGSICGVPIKIADYGDDTLSVQMWETCARVPKRIVPAYICDALERGRVAHRHQFRLQFEAARLSGTSVDQWVCEYEDEDVACTKFQNEFGSIELRVMGPDHVRWIAEYASGRFISLHRKCPESGWERLQRETSVQLITGAGCPF